MKTRIGRSGTTTDRLSPKITQNLYRPQKTTDLASGQNVIHKLLRLAHKPPSWSSRILRWRLDEIGQISLVLHWHYQALRAESAGRWERADFFWKQVITGLKPLAQKNSFWETLLTKLTDQDDVTSITPVELRQLLVEEIFVDTHCAFYNGYLEANGSLTLDNRAFRHFDYLRDLIGLFNLSHEHQKALLGFPLAAQMKLYRDVKKFRPALEAGQDLLNLFPTQVEYQNSLAELHMAHTLAQLSNKNKLSHSLRDAVKLEDGISRLNKLHRKYPYNITIFQLLGILHQGHAIKLGGAGRLSDALVAAQKAMVYHPGLKNAKKTRDELVQAMQQLQAKMAVLEAQIARNPRARLNADGERLRGEVRRGFSPLNAYMESPKAKSAHQAYQVAYGRHLWNEIGLFPSIDNWDDQDVALLNALTQIFNNPPPTEQSIPTYWRRAAADHDNLAEIDSSRIHDYLKRQLFEKSDESTVKEEVSPILIHNNPPLLKITATKKQRSSEPFNDWLFSHQGLRIKVQAVAAVVLLLMAGWFTVRNVVGTHYRNDAYNQIVAASTNQDHLGVIKGAEIFFSNPPLQGSDARGQQVMDLYTQSFVRWFLEQGDELDGENLAHIDQYRQLVVEAK